MSLQVWLPLTKDLKQQGLSNITVTNSGAIYSPTTGKLGGTYTVGSGKKIGVDNAITLGTTFSIAFWVKVNSWNQDWANIFKLYKDSYDYIGMCMSYTTSTQLGFHIYKNNGSNVRTGVVDGYDNFTANEWHHITITVTPSKVLLYKNGIVYRTTNISSTFPAVSNYSLYLGQSVIAGGLDCSINDFRIYDHCLSPMEIKELAKGLVLHYPLNRNGWGQENLLPISGSTIINSTQSFEFQGWVQNFYTKTWMNEHLTPGKQYTLSYTVTCLSIPDSNYTFKENRASPILVHQGNGWSQITTTSDGIKDTNMSVGQSRDYKCTFTFATASETYEYYGLCGYTALYRDTSNNAQYARFRIDNLKLEEGSKVTPWCPNSTDDLYYKMKGSYLTSKYDTNIYTEPDGSLWTKISHHNNPAEGVFSSSDTFTTGVYKDVNKWYDVERISGLIDKWEYMIKQKNTSDSSEIKYRWIQTKSPTDAVWNDVYPSSGNITHITTSGYSTSTTGGGIYVSPSASTRITVANSNNGNWYGGIGTFSAYQGGIPGYPNTVCTTGYVDLYLRIDNINNIEYDISGFGNNGTKVGELNWTSNTPKYNVSLDITSDSCARYIYTPHFSNLTNQISLACWVYQTDTTATSGESTTNYLFIAGQDRDYLIYGFGLRSLNGVAAIYIGTENSPTASASSGVNIVGAWHHLVATYDGSSVKIYVDGILKNSTAVTGNLDWTYTSEAFVVGKMSYGYTSNTLYFPFRGYISDVRLYATALSASDVLSLYQNSAYIDSSGNIYGTIHET